MRDSLGSGKGTLVNVLRSTLAIAIMGACLSPAATSPGKYSLSGTAAGGVAPGYDACVFGASVPITGPLIRPWEGPVDIGFSRIRIRNGTRVKRDTNLVAHSIRLTPRAPDSIIVSLTGAITVELVAVRDNDPSAFSGVWVCDNRFPFADDSTRPNPGGWGILTY